MNIFETLANDTSYDDYKPIIDSSPPEKTGSNIFESLAQTTPNDSFSFLETVKDVGQQIASKGAQGLLGNYGNIAEAVGLGTKENLLPGQEARQRAEFEKGIDLSDDDILPNYSRLPNSKDVAKGIKTLTGIEEGKTPSGRIAGNAAQFVGEGLSTPGGGVKGLASLAGAGLAGQSARELGAPEALASGIEIGGSIIPSAIQGKVNPTRKDAKEIAKAGRELGLSEKQITPLIQSERKAATLSKVARKGEGTKKLFESIKDSLGDSYQTIKNSVKNIGPISLNNQNKITRKFTSIRDDLSQTIKASPDKESAIKFIDEALEKIQTTGASPEELLNFWQDINRSVKWNSIQGGKKSLSRLKEPILEVLKNEAPQAAKAFEQTNKLYSKYSQITKKLKPDLVNSFLDKAELAGYPIGAVSLAFGNPYPLFAAASQTAARTLTNEMLTNPYFQNLSHKLVTNFNQGSFKAVKDLTTNAKNYLDKKHPEEDWEFLISNE